MSNEASHTDSTACPAEACWGNRSKSPAGGTGIAPRPLPRTSRSRGTPDHSREPRQEAQGATLIRGRPQPRPSRRPPGPGDMTDDASQECGEQGPPPHAAQARGLDEGLGTRARGGTCRSPACTCARPTDPTASRTARRRLCPLRPRTPLGLQACSLSSANAAPRAGCRHTGISHG